MSLITLSDVRKSYGNLDVLEGASFFLPPGRKAGLVGPNGAGKTTILRLITGEDDPNSGRITLQPNARVALLSQEPMLGDSRTVLEAAQRPTVEVQEIWARMTALEAADLHDEAALLEHDELHHRYQDARGYEFETRAREVLAGLGFLEDAWSKLVSVLSGGERTRLAMVQILVLQPDLLLLDEPTNHVDWEACEWLQEYLRRYPGAALMVSHDRYFLDEVAEEIVELERGRTRTYRGGYSDYIRKKAAEREQAEEAYRRQQEEIERQQAVIQRLRSHRKFDSMHSRERTLEKLEQEQIERPRENRQKLKIRPGSVVATGREVLSARNLAHAFGGKTLFSGVNLLLERGERLAVIGPNGAGKTTLLKALAGEMTPAHGTVEYGYRAQPAYFAQDLSSLDAASTVWDTIWDTGALDNQQTMQALHSFLFAGDAVFKQVADLSGGERTRLALCRLLVTRPNLLFLDEPTNHLDLVSREAVERALRNYPGALVVVSHDRYFLEAVATRLLELRTGAHRFFDGGYRRYRESFPQKKAAPAPARKPAASAPPVKTRAVSPSKRLPKLEAEIAALEERAKEITALLQDAGTWKDGASAAGLSNEFEEVQRTLESRYAEWEEVAAAAT